MPWEIMGQSPNKTPNIPNVTLLHYRHHWEAWCHYIQILCATLGYREQGHCPELLSLLHTVCRASWEQSLLSLLAGSCLDLGIPTQLSTLLFKEETAHSSAALLTPMMCAKKQAKKPFWLPVFLRFFRWLIGWLEGRFFFFLMSLKYLDRVCLHLQALHKSS